MFLLYSLLILFFPLLISLNVLIYVSIVKKALRKYIKPILEEKNLSYVEYKWPGLFSDGDFNENDFIISIVNSYGSTSNSYYAYIYYRTGNETKKTTVKIDTRFWVIKKVTYSSEL